MKVFPILVSLLGGYSAVYCFLYYAGKLKYDGTREKERKRKVEKHGGLIVIAGVILSITSLGLLISAF